MDENDSIVQTVQRHRNQHEATARAVPLFNYVFLCVLIEMAQLQHNRPRISIRHRHSIDKHATGVNFFIDCMTETEQAAAVTAKLDQIQDEIRKQPGIKLILERYMVTKQKQRLIVTATIAPNNQPAADILMRATEKYAEALRSQFGINALHCWGEMYTPKPEARQEDMTHFGKLLRKSVEEKNTEHALDYLRILGLKKWNDIYKTYLEARQHDQTLSPHQITFKFPHYVSEAICHFNALSPITGLSLAAVDSGHKLIFLKNET
ncbi:MAG: hypothetical protein HOO67_04400 [Candidatus Peribacteraceae bacterium]|nr:hypothetical protein [Candidatus Peribacteraceae bacterium]